jgi:hypothetical protein
MANFPSPFGGGGDDGDLFDDYDAFVPGHLPEPGPSLEEHDVLTGDAHVAFHQLTKELFEERGVYDMTFNYNLARLNLDTRHENAGYRYAEEAGDDAVLRAEFTPTTPFCPQTHTLTKGSFRAWNGELERHDYELVKVRAAPMHHQSDQINAQLAELEEKFQETGDVTVMASDSPEVGSNPMERSMKQEGSSRGFDESPF